MYEQYFDLKGRPFGSAPNADCWFPAEAIEQARVALTQSIDLAGGVGLLVGPPGTGKSLLLERLAADFGNTFQVVTLASARLCSRRALLQNILFELGRPYRGLAEGELRLDLIEHVRSLNDGVRGVLLLVDEAHGLPLKLLDELRMLTNLARHGNPCVQLVLGGSANLEEKMADPRMNSLSQRISARGYLESMVYAETCEYVRFQVGRVGGAGDLFSEDALGAVYHATGGTPRVINQLCNQILLSQTQHQENQITEAAVERAWAELQQLPAPWNEHTATTETGEVGQAGSGAGVIEFGPLEDELPAQGMADEPVPWPDASDVAAPSVEAESVDEPVTMEAVLDAPSPDPYDAATGRTAVDPFAEEFEEEYVVHDRYLATPVDMPQTGELAATPQPMVAVPESDPETTAPRATQSPLSGEQHLMSLTITTEERDSLHLSGQQPSQTDVEVAEGGAEEVRKRQEVASLIEDMAVPPRSGFLHPCVSTESDVRSIPEAVEPVQTPAVCDSSPLVEQAPCPQPGTSVAVSPDPGATAAYLVLHSQSPAESVLHSQSPAESVLHSQSPAESASIPAVPDPPFTATHPPETQQQTAFRDLLKPFIPAVRGRAVG